MIFGLCDACGVNPATVVDCWLNQPERDRERCAFCDSANIPKGEALRVDASRVWAVAGFAQSELFGAREWTA